ncbi:MAG: acylphosphatase [Candidatus Omnitrophota bacterium]
MKKRVHVYYDGRVQGVGFRFTTEYIAQELKVKGWVKNLPDGRVELVAEGKEDTLHDLLAKIKERFGKYILDELVDWEDCNGEFKSFGIRF